MDGFPDSRKYQRSDNLVCEVAVNVDGVQWLPAELCDISAGGLKFCSGTDFHINDKLSIDLTVYNMLSEFDIKLGGSVIRMSSEGVTPSYVVKLEDVNKYTQVQLDELVRNSLLFRNSHERVFREEQYSLPQIPRFGVKHHKLKVR